MDSSIVIVLLVLVIAALLTAMVWARFRFFRIPRTEDQVTGDGWTHGVQAIPERHISIMTIIMVRITLIPAVRIMAVLMVAGITGVLTAAASAAGIIEFV